MMVTVKQTFVIASVVLALTVLGLYQIINRALIIPGHLPSAEPADDSDKPGKTTPGTDRIKDRMILLSFDGPDLPVNKSKDGYPTFYYNRDYQGTGKFTTSLNKADARSGSCLQMELTEGALYAQFNPYGNGNTTRGFARDYSANPKGWKFNTYNRLRFWIKSPTAAAPHQTTGQSNFEFGTYVKRVNNPDPKSDESGGNHFYHHLNLPNSGTWTQVILNMHPSHVRSEPGSKEHGNQPHPTGEKEYNYFDALTRFYIQALNPPSRYPATYFLDEMEFYREPHEENDDAIYSITATHVPMKNRVIVTWTRNKDENNVKHEVRYSFKDVHQIGWEAADPAPQGIITPPGDQGYNSMVYDTTDLPLKKQPVTSLKEYLYVAVKPKNSKLFSQIAIPLTLP